jgi:hypothetical protein
MCFRYLGSLLARRKVNAVICVAVFHFPRLLTATACCQKETNNPLVVEFLAKVMDQKSNKVWVNLKNFAILRCRPLSHCRHCYLKTQRKVYVSEWQAPIPHGSTYNSYTSKGKWMVYISTLKNLKLNPLMVAHCLKGCQTNVVSHPHF